MANTYWAAETDSLKAATGAVERIRVFREYLRDTGRLRKMKRSWSAFYGYGPDGDRDASQVGKDGSERLQVNINHYATLAQQAMVLVTGQKPAFKVIATNTDYSSAAQAPLANGLNQYYDEKLGVYDSECSAVLSALLTGEGYVSVGWNAAAGNPHMVNPETQAVEPEGDIDLAWHSPLDVAYDISTEKWEKLQWCAILRSANKFDLAAIYPELADKITAQEDRRIGDDATLEFQFDVVRGKSPDTAFYWEIHHIPSKACPNGRIMKFFSPDIIMYDSIVTDEAGETVDNGYPYPELPLYRMSPEVTLGSNAGHTQFFDVLSLQQLIDMCAKVFTSAVNSGGLMNLWCPPGNKFNLTQIADGLNLIETNVKPEVLSMLEVKPEVINLMETLVQAARQRVAINDVVMGQPDKGMPAQAMALLHAQAIQFHSRLQAGYQRLVSQVRTGILRMLKKFASTQRVAAIAGLNNTSALKEFSKEDLSGVDRIQVEAVNPATNTFAGRMSLAQDLLDKGLIKNADSYIQLITTGKIEPMYDAQNQNQLRLKLEKELLQSGTGLPPSTIDPMTGQRSFQFDGKTYVMPLKTDPHNTDIPELLSVIQTPEARSNPEVVKAVLDVVSYKLELWKSVSVNEPDLAMVMGLPPPPSLQMLMGPGGPGGMTPNAGNNGPETPMGGSSPPPIDSPQGDFSNLPAGAPPIRQPKPPPNPLTGEAMEGPMLAAS